MFLYFFVFRVFLANMLSIFLQPSWFCLHVILNSYGPIKYATFFYFSFLKAYYKGHHNCIFFKYIYYCVSFFLFSQVHHKQTCWRSHFRRTVIQIVSSVFFIWIGNIFARYSLFAILCHQLLQFIDINNYIRHNCYKFNFLISCKNVNKRLIVTSKLKRLGKIIYKAWLTTMIIQNALNLVGRSLTPSTQQLGMCAWFRLCK